MGIFDNIKNAAQQGMGNIGGKRETFTFQSVPKSVAELSALPEAALNTPFQTAALVILALCNYNDDPSGTIEMINFLKGPTPLSGYDQQFLKDRLSGKGHVPRSFFAGATVENNYTPTQPLTVTVFDNPYSYAEAGYAKLLIKSSGADQERPIQIRQKGQGQWFLWENFLLSDIRQPAAADPWA